MGELSRLGILGLGTMGRNLALNFADNGVQISVFNREVEVVDELLKTIGDTGKVSGFKNLSDFVFSLDKPRIVVLLITAGKPVDEAIEQLLSYLEPGDIIVDSGNSYYKDTDRRYEYLKSKGIRFIGLGISGGSEGARKGPALMPGGDFSAYKDLEDSLKLVAAKSHYGPCVEYMGERSAGHFVKMVHNGIEYAIIGAISEVFYVMRNLMKMTHEEIADVFNEWNKKDFDSFLLRIASNVLKQVDEKTGKPYVDIILDLAEQKGTGLWFTQTALEIGVPAMSISASVNSRIVSTYKELRHSVAQKRGEIRNSKAIESLETLKDALLFSTLVAHTEGLWLLAKASQMFDYGTDLEKVLRVWRKGSILESSLIDSILEHNLNFSNCLIEDSDFRALLEKLLPSTMALSNLCREAAIPIPVINSSIDFYLSVTSENLPANLVQGIRDWFGYHGFYRVDQPGTVFHFVKPE
ncbi:MAG: NADP-dependent phosphogluconate dehydrogenase [Fervidobacterium sp.]|uniref:NADP-dependent phosphogluconate dehydrogenase n=1 Tax=Fervidobacterium sp. TaxID=1871331 RepID=UPI0040495D97